MKRITNKEIYFKRFETVKIKVILFRIVNQIKTNKSLRCQHEEYQSFLLKRVIKANLGSTIKKWNCINSILTWKDSSLRIIMKQTEKIIRKNLRWFLNFWCLLTQLCGIKRLWDQKYRDFREICIFWWIFSILEFGSLFKRMVRFSEF